MKVVGDRVLLELVSIRKKNVVIESVDEKDTRNFDMSMAIKQIGSTVEGRADSEGVKIGDCVILGQHVQYLASSLIHSEGNKVFVWHHIIPYDDIIGIDDENTPLEWQK